MDLVPKKEPRNNPDTFTVIAGVIAIILVGSGFYLLFLFLIFLTKLVF